MIDYELPEMEELFANLIWDNVPVKSRLLVELCEKEFDWKRTTTYTMLRRLIDKGLFENNNGLVTALISKEDFIFGQSNKFISTTFSGSLPAFITAFAKRDKLSASDIQEIKKLIDDYEEEE